MSGLELHLCLPREEEAKVVEKWRKRQWREAYLISPRTSTLRGCERSGSVVSCMIRDKR